MLVLSRKKNESIMIGGQIEVVVLGVENDIVKIGIRAPRDVSIYRKELYESIQDANRAAVQASLPIGQLAEMLRQGPIRSDRADS